MCFSLKNIFKVSLECSNFLLVSITRCCMEPCESYYRIAPSQNSAKSKKQSQSVTCPQVLFHYISVWVSSQVSTNGQCGFWRLFCLHFLEVYHFKLSLSTLLQCGRLFKQLLASLKRGLINLFPIPPFLLHLESLASAHRTFLPLVAMTQVIQDQARHT